MNKKYIYIVNLSTIFVIFVKKNYNKDMSFEQKSSEIFLSLVRISKGYRKFNLKHYLYGFKAGLKKKDLQIDEYINIYQESGKRELSKYRHKVVRDLIEILAFSDYWEILKDSKIIQPFINNFDEEAINNISQFNDSFEIVTNESFIAEKSIIIRIVYVLLGLNPYKREPAFPELSKSFLNQMHRNIIFEVKKLDARFRNILNLLHYEELKYSELYSKEPESWVLSEDKVQDLKPKEASQLIFLIFFCEKVLACCENAIDMLEAKFHIWGCVEKVYLGTKTMHPSFYSNHVIDENMIRTLLGVKPKTFAKKIKHSPLMPLEYNEKDDDDYFYFFENVYSTDEVIKWLNKEKIDISLLNEHKKYDYDFQNFNKILKEMSYREDKKIAKYNISTAKKLLNSEDEDFYYRETPLPEYFQEDLRFNWKDEFKQNLEEAKDNFNSGKKEFRQDFEELKNEFNSIRNDMKAIFDKLVN